MSMVNKYQISSAIYIDFDNIFTRIRDGYGGITANKFVNHTDIWIKFLENISILELYNTEDLKRVFTKKVIYANPVVYGEFRSIFVSHGFRFVDCPPMTIRKKTSTDMHMAVEILCDLYTKNYDEYILLSGDADFAPVISHISELSKKSIVLGVGPLSEKYTALANHVIEEDAFVDCFRTQPSYSKVTVSIPNEISQTARIIKRPEVNNDIRVTPEPVKMPEKIESISISLSDIERIGFPVLSKDEYGKMFEYILQALTNKKNVVKSVFALMRKDFPTIQYDYVKFFTSMINLEGIDTNSLNLNIVLHNILDKYFSSDTWRHRDNINVQKQHLIKLMSSGKEGF